MPPQRPSLRRGAPRRVIVNTGSPTPARELALRLLLLADDASAPGLDALLADARATNQYSRADLSLAREIAAGVCRHRRWLEQLLDRFLHHPLPAGAARVRTALLAGLYQAVYLDRIPAHTLVDETVRLVGTVRTEAAYRGLANAIMRRVVVTPREELIEPPDLTWPIRHSVPDWLASEAGQVLGNGEAEALFAALNEHAPLSLRLTAQEPRLAPAQLVDRLRGEIVDAVGRVVEVGPGRLLADNIAVRARGLDPESLPSFQAGLLTAEDEGAEVVGWLAGPRPGDRLLDLCASPGGKTSHLADLTGRRHARLVASDVSERKLDRLRGTLRRLGLESQVEVRLADSLAADGELAGSFDVVLVDAPCSGLGTLRRHPEIRWRRSPAAIRALARQQRELLTHAARFVAPGGHLIYSVCTFNRAETDGVADAFAAEHANFSPAPAPEGLPFDSAALSTGRPGRWRTWTHRDGCDSFFIARWQRAQTSA